MVLKWRSAHDAMKSKYRCLPNLASERMARWHQAGWQLLAWLVAAGSSGHMADASARWIWAWDVADGTALGKEH
jgi:hypothetical protein